MLRTRIVTALVLVTALLVAVFALPDRAWLVLSAALCGGAAWEWGGLARFARTPRMLFAALMAVACLAIGVGTGLADAAATRPAALAAIYLVSALFWFAIAPCWLSRKWAMRGVAAAVSVGVVVLLPTALALAHLRLLSPWALLAVIAMVSIADIAAYFTGRAFGRHKLAPAISPGKTWEGAVGAGVAVVVYGLIVIAAQAPSMFSPATLLFVVPGLAVVTAVSIQGDLFESLLKRQAGVKDSGALLPGHGGILDRIDSLTSTLPLAGLVAFWLGR